MMDKSKRWHHHETDKGKDMGSKKSEGNTFTAFIWKEMLLGNGISNGVINGIIYACITKGSVSHESYLFSTLLTNVILGLIVGNLYPVLIRQKLKKRPDIHVPYERDHHIVASLYSTGKWLVRMINIIVCLLMTTLFTMGIIGCLCLEEISVVCGSILRGVDCAFFSCVAYYFSMVFSNDTASSAK